MSRCSIKFIVLMTSSPIYFRGFSVLVAINTCRLFSIISFIISSFWLTKLWFIFFLWQGAGCCLPVSLNLTAPLFTSEGNVTGCTNPECAASYIREVSYALNYVNDPVQGCATEITVRLSEYFRNSSSLFEYFNLHFSENLFFCQPSRHLSIANKRITDLRWILLNCQHLKDLLSVLILLDLEVLDWILFSFSSLLTLFLADYLGIPCDVDANCTKWIGVCMPSKRCALPSLNIVRLSWHFQHTQHHG